MVLYPVLWNRIRIRIRIGSKSNGVAGSGFTIWIRIEEGKNGPEMVKKNFIFEVLDVFFWGLKASPVALESSVKAKV